MNINIPPLLLLLRGSSPPLFPSQGWEVPSVASVRRCYDRFTHAMCSFDVTLEDSMRRA